MANNNVLRLFVCPGQGITRKPTFEESTIAELLILEYFREDFSRRYNPPRLVIGQLDYLSQLTGRQTIDYVLKRMAADFKNELARVPLRKDIRSNRPGRNLKPDVLGIAVTNTAIVLELVEVTTFGQADTTLKGDLDNKLQALREKVLDERTDVIDSEYYAHSTADGTQFNVLPSQWRPAWHQMVCPLGIGSQTTTSTKVEWICYWPTFLYNPPKGKDGLILYEIHSMQAGSFVPQEVLDRIKEEVRRKRAQLRTAGAALTLTPWITDAYWQNNPKDRDAFLAVAAVGGIVLLGLLAWALWPVVAPVGAAELMTLIGGEVTTEAVTLAATANTEAVSISTQIMQSLARPVIYGLTP